MRSLQSSVVCIIITLCIIIVPTLSYVLVPVETTSDMQLWTPSTTLKLGQGRDGSGKLTFFRKILPRNRSHYF